MSATILHIAEAERWRQAEREGSYLPAEFANEGFIHCSEHPQVAFVADLLFRGRADLVLLEIDESRLEARVVRENLEGGTSLFPHVYGPIPVDAIIGVEEIPPGPDGRLTLPSRIAAAAKGVPSPFGPDL